MKEIITRLDEIIRLLRNEKEERGKIPHTPLKEKGEKHTQSARARGNVRPVRQADGRGCHGPQPQDGVTGNT